MSVSQFFYRYISCTEFYTETYQPNMLIHIYWWDDGIDRATSVILSW